MTSPTADPSEKIQQLLRGFPEATIQACMDFKRTGSNDAFERTFAGIIEYHLREKSGQPVAAMPGSTRLVQDLGLDSLTMVEMAFLFEDLFGAKLPHEDYIKIQTLDDLRTLLRSKIQAPTSA